MRLPVGNKQNTAVFSVYAPTPQEESVDKDRFCSELQSALHQAPADNKVIILGNVNARVGRDSEIWKQVLGRHGVGICNDYGCTEQHLVITNTIIQQKDRLKTLLVLTFPDLLE